MKWQVPLVLAVLGVAFLPLGASQVAVEDTQVCVTYPCSVRGDVATHEMYDVFAFKPTTAYTRDCTTSPVGSPIGCFEKYIPTATVTIIVDTVAYETAFDTVLHICHDIDVNLALLGCFGYEDDDIDCTYEPPQYWCPEYTQRLPADDDGVYYIAVGAHGTDDGNFRTPGLGEYELRITFSATAGPTLLTPVADNQPGEPGR